MTRAQGRKRSMSALVVVGNKNGVIGENLQAVTDTCNREYAQGCVQTLRNGFPNVRLIEIKMWYPSCQLLNMNC